MCGLAGFFDARPRSAAEMRDEAERMSAALAHRGPDDAGTWASEEDGVALGFRRLSIVDLSPEGHQPMASATGRFVIAFNGEVYNHPELRLELERGGARIRGRSDTAVMLAAFEAWGVEAALRRFVGMFAFALWDGVRRRLHLGRDRLGIKPLFVHRRPGRVAFASELKALLAASGFSPEVDPGALAAYLRHLYVPAPRSILRGVTKLPPGTLLTVRDPSLPLPSPARYWSAAEAASRGASAPFAGSEDEAADELERVLGDAVALRMRADVPLGAFLSGGTDSSAVVALMQARSPRPVRTFTIGFDHAEHDESAHAAAVARHLGTDHRLLPVSGADALEVVPDLPRLFDEPLADPSQIPTFLVSRLAREHVTVALTGDGGDELFTGYNRYLQGEATIRRAARLPAPLRRAGAAALRAVPVAAWDGAARLLAPALPPLRRARLAGDRAHKLAALLDHGSEAEMYRALLSQWDDPELLVPGAAEAPEPGEAVLRGRRDLAPMERMMLADQLGYLPDDLLAKVDRASMAVGLEARVPLLDHRVVELAWRLPRAMRVRGGRGKWLLRRVLHRHVPPALVERPKVGFSVPVDAWLRGPLRGWASGLLSPSALRRAGLLDPRPVELAWRAFLAGRGRGALALWAVVVFQAWHACWIEERPAPAAPLPAGVG
jgi:asparagine synthase (glutamine-hydrolysing)